jgi:23S rRNA pseudouridine1911/1915/1917 synthase
VGKNLGYDYREIIGARDDGSSVLDYLARRYAHTSRDRWLTRVEAGRILLNGIVAASDRRLRCGEELIWRRPPWQEPDAPRCFAILFEDEDVLAVAKPAGLPTLPGGGFLDNTLLALVRAYDAEASPLHRLGRWTSGLVLFARTPESRARLSRAWKERSVLKRYLARATGRACEREFAVSVPIGRIPYAPLKRLYAASARGKPAFSRVRVLEQRDGDFLAEVTIETGRPHQIRIHLAAAGHPLVGDPLYGPGGIPGPASTALPGDPGYHLHAVELELDHPGKRSRLRLRCPAPPPLRPALGSAVGFSDPEPA